MRLGASPPSPPGPAASDSSPHGEQQGAFHGLQASPLEPPRAPSSMSPEGTARVTACLPVPGTALRSGGSGSILPQHLRRQGRGSPSEAENQRRDHWPPPPLGPGHGHPALSTGEQTEARARRPQVPPLATWACTHLCAGRPLGGGSWPAVGLSAARRRNICM